ncbi:helix-turn-helix domain-containing protein [Hymenobacter sp. BT18]|uniref:helix-turn-helix domain-containing protein n=1 Tax=Hymenobacter sp. BT18 TaxID=2835648 RepID=UPI00143E3D51|nr:helix-turn-helix domain-containing protein [Hymenobacter sp. BT18]QIX62292.1 helix-turn-helix domain-containing protein [Hymenobacter sp. BT18]
MIVDFQNGQAILRLSEPQEQRMIQAAAVAYAKEKAEQEALQQVYTITTLAKRLGCGKTKTYELINAGVIRHQLVGNKAFITERAVREWFGDK